MIHLGGEIKDTFDIYTDAVVREDGDRNVNPVDSGLIVNDVFEVGGGNIERKFAGFIK